MIDSMSTSMSRLIANNAGTIFIAIISILFICLKLAGYISWPWWLVLMPIFISVGICIGLALLAMLLVIVKCKELS